MIQIKISDHPEFPGYRRIAELVRLVYDVDPKESVFTSFKVKTFNSNLLDEKKIIEASMQFTADEQALLNPNISDIDLFLTMTNGTDPNDPSTRVPLKTILENTIWELDRSGKLNDRLGLGLVAGEPNLT